MMTIVYKVKNGLYINFTNRCPSNCTFCLRNDKDAVYGSAPLWLEREPSVEEVKAAIDAEDMAQYEEVVFCGYGEPTERLDDLLEVAKYLKEKYGKKVRVNTNGLSDLINSKDTSPLFKGVVDVVSISLNTPDKVKYFEITRNKFGIDAFDSLLEFAKNVKQYVGHVVLTTVSTTITKEEEELCKNIADSLGVEYRIRQWEG